MKGGLGVYVLPPETAMRRVIDLLRRGLAAAVLLSACACAAPPDDTPRRPTLLPDVGARPSLVAVSANSARRAALRNADLVTNLVNGFPSSTRFFILTNDRAAFPVTRTDQPNRIRFLDLPFENLITIWPQDPFLVLTEPGGAVTLLTSKEFERADDAMMANIIAWDGAYGVQPSDLFFEGGNIVSDRERVFIGANTIRQNATELRLEEPEVVRRFEEELGRPVLVVGAVPQAVSHIDVALTPLGAGRLALADAAAGARIAERALKEDPGSVAAFEAWTEDHFFGDPSIREIPGVKGPLTAPDVRGRTREMIDWSRKLAPLFDHLAKSLEQHGYRVERIPWLFGGPDIDTTAAYSEWSLRPGYPMLTYNNVLIEEDADGKRVYLPRYGWPAMDDAASQAWEALGFSTRPIEGLTISAMYGGALRCAVKVLAR